MPSKALDAVKDSLQMLHAKHLIAQSEERILQIDQSKNASKHLQHHVSHVQAGRSSLPARRAI